MPQTREHFHICRLLGVPRGLVVLTKCDLADADTRAIAEMEALELVAGSFLEGRPVVPVSARTGEGLDGLREALLALAREAPLRSSEGSSACRRPGLSMKGFAPWSPGRSWRRAGRRRGDRGPALRAARPRARPPGPRGDGRARDGGDAHRGQSGRRRRPARTGRDPGPARHAAGDPDDRRRAPSSPRSAAARRRGARPGARGERRSAGPRPPPRAEALEPGCSALAQLRLETAGVVGRGTGWSCAPTRRPRRSAGPSSWTRFAAPPVVGPGGGREAARGDVASRRGRGLVEEAGPAGIDAPLLAARLAVPLARLAAELPATSALAELGRTRRRGVAGSLDRLGSTPRRSRGLPP